MEADLFSRLCNQWLAVSCHRQARRAVTPLEMTNAFALARRAFNHHPPSLFPTMSAPPSSMALHKELRLHSAKDAYVSVARSRTKSQG